MRAFQHESVFAAYQPLLNQLMLGDIVPSRAGETYEIEDMCLLFEDPTRSCAPERAKTPRSLGFIEGAQLVGSKGDGDLMARLFPAMSSFTDFSAMYGDRVADYNQIDSLLQKLRDEPDTRQAVLTLWDPSRDNVHGRADYPCTIAIQFRIRKHKLDMSVSMRSNDIIRGFYHDAVQFSLLQITLAAALGVPPGKYFHHAGSFHLYTSDLATVDKHIEMIRDNRHTEQPVIIKPLAKRDWSYGQIRSEVQAALYSTNSRIFTPGGEMIREMVAKRHEYITSRVAPAK